MAKKKPTITKKSQLLEEPEIEFTEEELQEIQARLQEVRESASFKERIEKLNNKSKPVETRRYNVTVSHNGLIFEG